MTDTLGMTTHKHDNLNQALADWRKHGCPGQGCHHSLFQIRRSAGLHIRAHAAAHGITQMDVARRLGKPFTQVTFQDLLDAVHDPADD